MRKGIASNAAPATLSRAHALNFRPVKNQEIIEGRSSDGMILLIYPIQPRPWISRLLKRFGVTPPARQTRKLELDELGGDVWRLLNGHRRVVEVIRAFAVAHRISEEEAEPAVTQFLRTLGNRGLIAMAEPVHPKAGADAHSRGPKA